MVIAVTGANACDSAATRSPVATLALEPFAQHSVRLSERGEIALVAETTACVVDSYESTVACYNPQGTEVAVWGREGEGPGEFPKGGPGDVLSMGNGRLGAWSSGHRRLSVFGIDGMRIVDFNLTVPGVFAGGPMAFLAEAEGWRSILVDSSESNRGSVLRHHRIQPRYTTGRFGVRLRDPPFSRGPAMRGYRGYAALHVASRSDPFEWIAPLLFMPRRNRPPPQPRRRTGVLGENADLPRRVPQRA